MPLLFGVDIQSQSKVSPETKKSNMLPGSYFESDVTENQ